MGNCCSLRKSSMVWAGDDWDNPSAPHQNTIAAAYSSSNDYTGAIGEVKIKISKMELQELLEIANVQGIPVGQVLARSVINKNGNSHHHVVEQLFHRQHHPWKPTLKSIPE